MFVLGLPNENPKAESARKQKASMQQRQPNNNTSHARRHEAMNQRGMNGRYALRTCAAVSCAGASKGRLQGRTAAVLLFRKKSTRRQRAKKQKAFSSSNTKTSVWQHRYVRKANQCIGEESTRYDNHVAGVPAGCQDAPGKQSVPFRSSPVLLDSGSTRS